MIDIEIVLWGGSFDRIMGNLKNLKNNTEINISLNCNISSDNHIGVKLLLKYLQIHNCNFPIFFSLVFDNGVNNTKVLSKTSTIWFDIHKEAMKYGHRFTSFYRDMYFGCSMTQRNSHIIGADGNLYKCLNDVNNSKYFLCNMDDYGDLDYEKKLSRFLNYKIGKEECESCELYPICYGGCEYNNSINGYSCSKNFYYKNEIKLIKKIVNAKN